MLTPISEVIDGLRNQPLSDRLQLAIDAMRKLETIPGWRLDMDTYHSTFYNDNGVAFCTACLGGAAAVAYFSKYNEFIVSRTEVIAQYIGDERAYELLEVLTDYEESIDKLRLGMVSTAYVVAKGWHRNTLVGDIPENLYPLSRKIPSYYPGMDNHPFYRTLEVLIIDLQALNY